MPFKTLAIVAFGLLMMLAARPAHAQACGGAQPSGAALERWTVLGAADGPLGCPKSAPMPTAASPSGAKATETDFASGVILQHTSGPRAGQTFAVSGCIWRLYFQYGGPSGWLGLPTGDAVNFPDGQRQAFEGGRVTDYRSAGCAAERTAELTPPAAGPPAGTAPLEAWFDPARSDHLSAAGAGVVKHAQDANYQRLGVQAQVYDAPGPGLSPLKLFWNDQLGDHIAAATTLGQSEALASGYGFEASEGYVWRDPHPDAVALAQYRDPASGHHWLTAGPDEADQARAKGFVFVRIEGYAPGP